MRTRRGHWSEDPRRLRLMEWLTTPKDQRIPPSQNKLAAELGVSPRSIRDWMADPLFRDSWDRQAKEIVGSPERIQEVLDTLYEAATDPSNRNHVQAAKLYLEATESIKPPTMEVTVKKATDMTDAELDELIRQGAAALQAERTAAPDADVIQLPTPDG